MRPRPNLRTAEHQAHELLARLDNPIRVDVHKVAEQLNLKVHYQELEDAVSGMLMVKNGQAAIGVNKHHHFNRQRFTIAHEIGHYLLHARKAPIFIENLDLYRNGLSSEGTDAWEVEANTFAAELLMPEEVLKRLVKDIHIDPFFDEDIIRRLATRLQVSPQALTVRLTRLGMLSG